MNQEARELLKTMQDAAARTMLALHDAGYLGGKIGGGMAITEAGRAAVEKFTAKSGK
jgi:hypothetical protein